MTLKTDFIMTAFNNKKSRQMLKDYKDNKCKVFFRPMDDAQRYGIFIDGDMRDEDKKPFHSEDEIIDFIVDSYSKVTIKEMVENDFKCEEVMLVNDLIDKKGHWTPSLKEHITFFCQLVDTTESVCAFCRENKLKFNNKSDITKLKEFIKNEKV